MRISLEQTVKLLSKNDKMLILTHTHPDGDTLGSGFSLCYALRSIGKKVNVLCADSISEDYDLITEGYEAEDFEAEYIISVDVASPEMLGRLEEKYGGRVDLCIDHHGSNSDYAKNLLLDHCAATTELIFSLVKMMDIPVTKKIADCIYIGISTDTGCFKYANTTSASHRIAAELIDAGADYATVNRIFFDTKTKSYIKLEKMAMAGLEMHFDDRCAIMCVTKEILEKSKATQEDCAKLAPITRQIEGVLVGVVLREQDDGTFKASVRTQSGINASDLCAKLGGGGHAAAAGCTLHGSLEESKKMLLDSIEEALNDRDNTDK
ncbi:MAG: DHH family phosphoesterase [Clostridiales bacterium]|nr:DHH family phosphoesterase [Clostridiales bacterium]